MAKALLGHVGAVPDRRLLEEIAFLRSRVRTLQAEVDELRADQALRIASDLRVPDLAETAYADSAPAYAGAIRG